MSRSSIVAPWLARIDALNARIAAGDDPRTPALPPGTRRFPGGRVAACALLGHRPVYRTFESMAEAVEWQERRLIAFTRKSAPRLLGRLGVYRSWCPMARPPAA